MRSRRLRRGRSGDERRGADRGAGGAARGGRAGPGQARRLRAERGRAARALPARRRAGDAAPDRAARLSDRRPRRPRERLEPALDVPRDLQRHGAELALSLGDRCRPRPGGDQPAADPAARDAADALRARGRVRLPLRHVQHRRPGAVRRRLDHVGLGRLVVRRHERPAPHRPRRPRRRRQRGDLGRDRRLPQGDRRRARGDLDDHAQLDRLLARQLGVRPRRPAPEQGARRLGARVERHRREHASVGLLGRPAAAGAPRRVLRRTRRARRLLADAEPHDARILGARGRLQSGGGPVRRHRRGAQLLPRHGDLRRLRGGRRLDGRPRLGVPPQRQRHPGVPDRLHRDRGRAARVGTLRSGRSSRRSCSRPCSTARRPAISIRASSVPTSPAT